MYKLKTSYYKEPFEFFLFEDFFSEEQLKDVWKELDFIVDNDLLNTDDQKELGTAQDNNVPIAKRNGAFLSNVYKDFRKSSKIYQHIKQNFLWNEELNTSFPNSTLIRYLPRTNEDSVLVSLYKDGDYYKPHGDQSVMTLIVYLWKGEKSFEGGDLSFVDQGLVFEPSYNEAILFPGCYEHEVSEIKSTIEGDTSFKRTSITLFLTVGLNRTPNT